jgi:glycerate dehydrogenase
MHILNLAGRAFHYNAYARDGRYSAGSIHVDADHPFTELAGKTIGIVGMGAIGRKVATIAEAFGMEVIYFSTSGTSHCKEYESVSLDDLLRRSDVISIHAPFNERTKGLIGYDEFCKMKPTAFLVNTGRGGIAVEADLVRAIDEGKIAGAGIDVYQKEPIPLDHPFLKAEHPERIILSPHIAWYSFEARARLAHEMAENIKKGW